MLRVYTNMSVFRYNYVEGFIEPSVVPFSVQEIVSPMIQLAGIILK